MPHILSFKITDHVIHPNSLSPVWTCKFLQEGFSMIPTYAVVVEYYDDP